GRQADSVALTRVLPAEAPGRQNPDVQSPLESEHKQVTVLFADLKGSTRDTEVEELRRAQQLAVAHCHLGLGKVYQRTDQREQARRHLTTATTMYREMDMTYWLEQAGPALRELP
ncbi:MAG TPA: hypothetical protein VGZ22_05380, partial [Isosphaeraceae bacterium]|nr:hypothetical protein [Isosphaeraceae bacterium]